MVVPDPAQDHWRIRIRPGAKAHGHEVVKINNNASKPSVSRGRLLIEVHAAGVNPVDWKIREGYMKQMAPLQFPATLGGDFSGIVTEKAFQVLKRAMKFMGRLAS